jgi:hypothetical protein
MCRPLLEKRKRGQRGNLWMHNAFDCREKWERQNIKHGLWWTSVVELEPGSPYGVQD